MIFSWCFSRFNLEIKQWIMDNLRQQRVLTFWYYKPPSCKCVSEGRGVRSTIINKGPALSECLEGGTMNHWFMGHLSLIHQLTFKVGVDVSSVGWRRETFPSTFDCLLANRWQWAWWPLQAHTDCGHVSQCCWIINLCLLSFSLSPMGVLSYYRIQWNLQPNKDGCKMYSPRRIT